MTYAEALDLYDLTTRSPDGQSERLDVDADGFRLGSVSRVDEQVRLVCCPSCDTEVRNEQQQALAICPLCGEDWKPVLDHYVTVGCDEPA